MSRSIVQIAEDVFHNNLQFTHINCVGTSGRGATNLTASTVWNTAETKHIVITPISTSAYVNITANGVTTVAGSNTSSAGDATGKFIPYGSSYTTIIRAGERISASATVNVVELGEI
tara:strand:- start:342 stop:692 length:351 start_codon:yes stop_codon:yes gene_type:complete